MRTMALARVAAVLALAVPGGTRAFAADPAPPAFDPTRVHLAWADDEWMVWMDEELIETTRHHRAQRHVRTYRLQKFGEETTRPVLRTRGTHAHDVVTVLADGTLCVTYATTLSWAKPAGQEPVDYADEMASPVAHEGKRWNVRRGSPAGLFLQEYALNEDRHVLFVPLAGRDLVWGSATRVTKDPVETSIPPPPHVDGDVAWCGRSGVDLKNGRRYELPPQGGAVRALGGGYVADFNAMYRLSDGARVGLPHGHQVFAVRKGLVYAALPEDAPEDAPGKVTVFAHAASGGAKPLVVAEARARGVSSSYAFLRDGNVVRYGGIVLVWSRASLWIHDGAWRRFGI